MMADIKYSPSDVQKAGNDFKQASATLKQKTLNLLHQVQAMRWESAAANQFKTRFNGEWAAGLSQLYNALDETGVSLINAASTYTSADRQTEAEIQKSKTITTGYSR